QYAVGRIAFDTPEEYAQYARSVVEAETRGVVRERRVTLFGVGNPDDYATTLSADRLVNPLAEKLATPADKQKVRDWKVSSFVVGGATQDALCVVTAGG